MDTKGTNLDVLKSYYFARLLDMQLMKQYSHNEEFDSDLISNAIRLTEREF